MSSKDYLHVLRERGLIKQISNEEGLMRALQRLDHPLLQL